MDSTIIPAEVWKFEGGSVRELHQDDLLFLVRVFRNNPRLGRQFEMELRRRVRLRMRSQMRRGCTSRRQA